MLVRVVRRVVPACGALTTKSGDYGIPEMEKRDIYGVAVAYLRYKKRDICGVTMVYPRWRSVISRA